MAGIYIHIPFCRQACNYCDFHFSTLLKNKPALISALVKEVSLRKDELAGLTVETVYFGGGTPSILEAHEFMRIWEELQKHFIIVEKAEVTLEANPDDLTIGKINELKESPVNRLSIGVQSFFDEDLVFMNRAHSATEAWTSVQNAMQAGFTDITLDLIYGSPTLSKENWLKNLKKVEELRVGHLSAYSLTVEPKTALAHAIKEGKITPLSSSQAAEHFQLLMDWAKSSDFEQYEISNFARAGRYAKHNTAYWQQKPYLGLGPSAHSYNGTDRRWNVRNNQAYARKLEKNEITFEQEHLSLYDRFNEYLMTGLRTKWGIAPDHIEREFGAAYKTRLEKELIPFLKSSQIKSERGHYCLTENGKLVADKITAALFAVE